MQERFDALKNTLHERLGLEELPIPDDLVAPEANERGVEIRCYNWAAPQFTKISATDTSVETPPMHQLNSMFYPRPQYDVPIFLFLTVITKHAVITIFNACCPFDDEDYAEKYVAPLLAVVDKYPPFTGKQRDPDWFVKYRNDATVFGVFSKEELDTITQCGLEIVDTYLDLVTQADPIEDPKRLERVANFQAMFREDIRTKDVGRSVLEKLTNEDIAHRLFYEVAT